MRLYSSWPWTNRRRLMPIGLFYFSCGFWYLPLLTTQVNCLYSEQSYKGLCVCVCVFMCEPLSLWSHCISFYFKINLLFCWIFPCCLSDSLLITLEPTLHGFVKSLTTYFKFVSDVNSFFVVERKRLIDLVNNLLTQHYLGTITAIN